MCNEAALIAARLSSLDVKLTHFEQAIERVVAGIACYARIILGILHIVVFSILFLIKV